MWVNWISVYLGFTFFVIGNLLDPDTLAVELAVSDTSLIDPNHFNVSVDDVLSELLFSPTTLLLLIVVELILLLAVLPLPILPLQEMPPLFVTTFVKFVILLAVERSFWDQ